MTRMLLFIVLLSCPSTLAQAEPRPVLDWLNYDSAILEDYVVEIGIIDPARNLATPKAETNKRVLLLIPSASVDAYSMAVNTILRGFHDASISTRFDIWYYGKNEDIAQEALDWAYAEHVDLIISVGSSATSYLANHHTGHAIPAVTSASKDPVASGHVADAAKGSGTNIAYTSINVESDTLVGYLRRLVPELSTIGLLYATSNSSAVLTQVNPLHASADRLGLNIVDITVDDDATASQELEDMLPAGIEQMSRLDPGLAKSILLVTGSTSVYEQISLINKHAKTLPVISMLPDIVRAGEDSALLSIGVNLESALKLSTVYAIQVINGHSDPGEFQVGVVVPPDLAINFRVAERVGVEIPFSFLESSTFIYDMNGEKVVENGQRVADKSTAKKNWSPP